jgi:hypothetical protein
MAPIASPAQGPYRDSRCVQLARHVPLRPVLAPGLASLSGRSQCGSPRLMVRGFSTTRRSNFGFHPPGEGLWLV